MPNQDKTVKAAYDRARRDQWKAANPNWRELEKQRRANRPPEQRDRARSYAKEWRAAHPDYMPTYNRQRQLTGKTREWQQSHPESVRRTNRKVRLKRKYGISLETYDAMYARQDGLCAICHRPETLRIRGTLCMFAVDNDAITGAVRGLLCVNCNMMIGGAHHDPNILGAAIRYLVPR